MQVSGIPDSRYNSVPPQISSLAQQLAKLLIAAHVTSPPPQAARSAPVGSTLQGNRQLGQGFDSFLRDSRRPTVALIDDFSGANSHGQQMDGILSRDVATRRYNIAGGDRNANIAASLDDVTRRVQAGEKIDAVNLSQQNFQSGGQVAQKIAALQKLGVPVVVAAGNAGPGQSNQLARGAALVVENSAPGSEQRSGTSGIGNIRAEGEFTSQATAVVAARAARLHAEGRSLQQIQQAAIALAGLQGGSLDR